MRPATPEGPAVQSLAAPLKPLAGDQWLVDLPVEAHRPAVVGLPLGTTSPRPVLVVTHGALGLTRPYCEMWRGIVGDRAFVLCPRGARMSPYLPDDVSGHFYPSHLYLADEVTAALAALHARYGERVDLRAPVYAGFSQGANMGALVLPDHPARFARAALVEGGVGEYLEWNVAVAARWHEAGATRVLFACGRHDCAEAARQSRHALRLGGLESALVYVGGAGHHWDGPMQRALEDSFAWLVEGDARFAAPTMHASDDPDPLTAAMGPRLGSLMASRSLEADGAPAPTAIEATPER